VCGFSITTCTASFAKFSLIGRYLSKSLGTTHVPVQEFALQVFCRHLYQYVCCCQYFSLVPLDSRELCKRGCTRTIMPGQVGGTEQGGGGKVLLLRVYAGGGVPHQLVAYVS